MSSAFTPAHYEVIANSIAFDHEVFSHGDVIDEHQAGFQLHPLLRAGLIKKLPSTGVTELDEAQVEVNQAVS